MEVKELVKKYLGKTRMIQISTSAENQPWICTVYYAFDDNQNIYWLSTPERRHSKDIAKNPKVAAAIVFSQEPYPEGGVQGLQLEGNAQMLSGKDEEFASKLYIDQLEAKETLLEDIRSGKNPHKLYRIKPSKFVLFDEQHFPGDARQEWTV